MQGLYNAEVVAGSVLCADVFGTGDDAVVISGDVKGVLRLSRWPCSKDSEQREFRCHGGGEVRCARFSCDSCHIWFSDSFGSVCFMCFQKMSDSHLVPIFSSVVHDDPDDDSNHSFSLVRDLSILDICSRWNFAKVSGNVFDGFDSHWRAQCLETNSDTSNSHDISELLLTNTFGYSGGGHRQNVVLNRRSEVVYSVGSVCVVLEREQNIQRHFREHKGDVICLALHPDGVHIVSGDCAHEPRMWVWSSETGSAVSVMQGFYSTGSCIASCCFTRDGRRVVSVGSDVSHSVAVWEMSSGQLLSSERGSKGPIFAIACCPKDGGLVTVGQSHIKFWTLTSVGSVGLRFKKGDFGKLEAARSLLLCVEFSADGYALTGTSDGSILVWKDAQIRHTVRAHQGPVFSLWLNSERGMLASGGKDGNIMISDSSYKIERSLSMETQLPNSHISSSNDCEVRSVCWIGPRILVGLGGDVIVDLVESTGEASVIVSGHKSGDVWCVAPSPVSPSSAASVGSDGWLRLWDSRSRRPSNSVNLRKGVARCVSWSPDGRLLSVGFDSGAIIVVDSLDFKEVWFVHHRSDSVLCAAFSADGTKLAAGCAAGVIDLFDWRFVLAVDFVWIF
jgi:WD40 repeat protein